MMNEPVDLTAITTPFGLLDDATQGALMAHGGPWEYLARTVPENLPIWNETTRPAWWRDATYRVRPAPVEPPKPREWVIHGGLESVIPYVPGVPIPGGYIRVMEVLE